MEPLCGSAFRAPHADPSSSERSVHTGPILKSDCFWLSVQRANRSSDAGRKPETTSDWSAHPVMMCFMLWGFAPPHIIISKNQEKQFVGAELHLIPTIYCPPLHHAQDQRSGCSLERETTEDVWGGCRHGGTRILCCRVSQLQVSVKYPEEAAKTSPTSMVFLHNINRRLHLNRTQWIQIPEDLNLCMTPNQQAQQPVRALIHLSLATVPKWEETWAEVHPHSLFLLLSALFPALGLILFFFSFSKSMSVSISLWCRQIDAGTEMKLELRNGLLHRAPQRCVCWDGRTARSVCGSMSAYIELHSYD